MNRNSLTRRLITAPYTIWMAIFVLVPIALVVYYALTDADGHFTTANILAIADFGKQFGYDDIRFTSRNECSGT